jgi:hypothetical protein
MPNEQQMPSPRGSNEWAIVLVTEYEARVPDESQVRNQFESETKRFSNLAYINAAHASPEGS